MMDDIALKPARTHGIIKTTKDNQSPTFRRHTVGLDMAYLGRPLARITGVQLEQTNSKPASTD